MKEKMHEHNHDGIDNHEHFLDMFSQIEMLFQNIKDNTDGAFELLKIFEKQNEEDEVDVIKIDASQIIEIEKLSQPVFEEINKIKDRIVNEDDFIKNQELIQKYFEFIKNNEEKSSLLYNNLIKKLS